MEQKESINEERLEKGYRTWGLVKGYVKNASKGSDINREEFIRLLTFRTSHLIDSLKSDVIDDYYRKAYRIFREELGNEHRETCRLKDEIVDYYSFMYGSCSAEETLWLAQSSGPIILMASVIFCGFTWNALIFIGICICIFLLWRVIHFFYYVLSKMRYYKKVLDSPDLEKALDAIQLKKVFKCH